MPNYVFYTILSLFNKYQAVMAFIIIVFLSSEKYKVKNILTCVIFFISVDQSDDMFKVVHNDVCLRLV